MQTKMLGIWLAAIATTAGCTTKADAPVAAGSASAPIVSRVAGDAGAVVRPIDARGVAGACLPSASDGVLDAFTATDAAATVCVQDAVRTCIQIDLQTGVASPVPAPAAVAPAAGGYTIQDDLHGTQICKGSVCTKLAIAPPIDTDPDHQQRDPHQIAISANGQFAIANLPDESVIAVFDTASGRRVRALPKVAAGSCLEGARFLGDVIYETHTNCADPGAAAELYTTGGVRIGALDGPAEGRSGGPDDRGVPPVGSAAEGRSGEFDVEHAVPVQLAGDTWAVPGSGGAGALVFDPRTAKVLRKLEGTSAPSEACATCFPLGKAAHFTASPLAVTPSGKLVEVGAIGRVWVLDPATGQTLQAWPIATCAASGSGA